MTVTNRRETKRVRRSGGASPMTRLVIHYGVVRGWDLTVSMRILPMCEAIASMITNNAARLKTIIRDEASWEDEGEGGGGRERHHG